MSSLRYSPVNVASCRYSIERPVTVPIPANAPKENNTYDLCQEAFDKLPKEDQKMYTKMNAPVKWLPPNAAAAQTVSEGKAEEWLPPELDRGEDPGGLGPPGKYRAYEG